MKGPCQREMMESLAAVSEQFRKTVETGTEQARVAMDTAREQFEKNLGDAQQIQSDLTRMVVKFNEQESQFVSEAFASFWDASLSMLKLASFGQEQTEKVVLQLVEQRKLSREQGVELVKEAIKQGQRHQAELQRFAEESLRVGFCCAGKTAA